MLNTVFISHYLFFKKKVSKPFSPCPIDVFLFLFFIFFLCNLDKILGGGREKISYIPYTTKGLRINKGPWLHH